jgi:HD-like signal output (HDOD) protein
MGTFDDLDAMDRVIDRVGQLHTAPVVALEILELTQNFDFEVPAVVRCLEKDPALTAKILQLVNSARYGLARSVGSLHQAVTYIGQRSLRLLAVTFCLVEELTRGASGRVYTSYWRRALTIAAVADRLAASTRKLDRNTAYVGGLLADLGMLVLAQTESKRYVPLCKDVPHGPELVAAERTAFRFGHPALGARLIERWNLPAELALAAERHHEPPDQCTGPLDLLICTAELVAEVLWTPSSPRLTLTRAILQRAFDVNTDAFITMAVECKTLVSEQAESFAVDLDGAINCEMVIETARRQHFNASLDIAMDMDNLVAILDDHPAAP